MKYYISSSLAEFIKTPIFAGQHIAKLVMEFFKSLNKIHPNLNKIGLFVFLFMIGISTFGTAKRSPKQPLSDGYYVVLGVFKFINNAKGYTKFINESPFGFQADYGLLPSNAMHYVFAAKFDNIDSARYLRNRLRGQETFADAWVLQVAIESTQITGITTEALEESNAAGLVANMKVNESANSNAESKIESGQETNATGLVADMKVNESANSNAESKIESGQETNAAGLVADMKVNESANSISKSKVESGQETNATGLVADMKVNESVNSVAESKIESGRETNAAGLVADMKVNESANSIAESKVESGQEAIETNAESIAEKEVPVITEAPVLLSSLPEGMYRLYINTINVETKHEVVGPMEVVDAKRAKVMKTIDSHQLAEVADPKNGSAEIMISSKIFGFRREHHILSLDNPVTDDTKDFAIVNGDTIVVNYELQRYKKGDVFTLFNVIFFKNASIMRPESKNEMTNLLAMLHENPKYKVLIHGHTNTNSPGQLINMAEGATNYFALSPEDEINTASAKKLSFFRAFTIHQYLMENGISEDRMEVKGWGGKKMIYEKYDAQAKNNVRVEIEILEN